MKKINYFITSLIALSITTLSANSTGLSAISGNQSDAVNQSSFSSTRQQVEDQLDQYYQDDTRVFSESQNTDITNWVQIGLPRNCGPWYKTVTDQRRNCTIEEAQLQKDKVTESVLLSQLEVAFSTREVPYVQTSDLPPIILALEVRPIGVSSPLYRNGEEYEVIWSASGVDRCDVNVISGNDNGFSGTRTLTAVNNGPTRITQEITLSCFTPAEPVPNFPVNVARQTIEIMPNLPVVNLTAPDNALANRNVTVSWATQHANMCNGVFDTNINNISRPNGSRTYQYTTVGNQTVSVTCTNQEGESVTETRTINVTWPAATVNFNVDRTTANINQNIVGTWTSSDATSCNASFMSGASNGLNGSGSFSYTTPGTRTVSVTCLNGGGVGTTVERTVTINDPVPTVTFNAPASAIANQNFNVNWSSGPIISGVNYSTSCNASFVAGTSNGLTGSMNLSYPTAGARTLSVTCSNASGQTTTVTRTVNIQEILPTVNLTASPTSINLGASTTLTWSSTNATSCTNNFSGTGVSGSRSVTPTTTGTQTYTITCTSSTGNTATRSVNVTVNAPPLPLPTVTISASPNNIVAGASTTVTWNSTNAASCTNNFSATGTSGSVSRNPASTTTYTITCTNATGSRSASATVSVIVPETPAFFDVISCGATHCVYFKNGNLMFVGGDDNGQSGLNSVCLGCSHTSSRYNQWRWAHLDGSYNPTVTKAWANAGTTFVRHSNGSIWAAGSNQYGQLGRTVTGCNPSTTNNFHTKCWVEIPFLNGATDITSIGVTTFAVRGGTLFRSQGNQNGASFVSTGITGVRELMHNPYGSSTLLFERTNGQLWEYRNGTATNTGLVTNIAFSTSTAQYAVVGGILYSKGQNYNGQLGTGDTTNRSTWTNTGMPAASVAATATRAYVIRGGFIWQTNSNGTWSNTNVRANYLIGNGDNVIYGATSTGGMVSLGRNREGQLGQGTTATTTTPTTTFQAVRSNTYSSWR